MGTTAIRASASGTVHRRIDPARDGRRLVLFFGGLIAFYALVLVIARPDWGGGEDELAKIAVGLMFAPTVGALLAAVFGPGVIRFGRPTWWILAGLLPPLVVLPVTLVALVTGEVELHAGKLATSVALIVPASLGASLSAVGEEIGWRGFLWPLLRRRSTFIASSALMFGAWWVYHAPLTFLGLYGFVGGLPAFTVAILGFVLFVGVLTERSRSIWPSVIAHGSWNALVATSYSWLGRDDEQGFTGSRYLLGEFGWLAAIGMLVLGLGFAWWHLRTPTKDGLSPSAPTGYEAPVQWLSVRDAPATKPS